MKTWEDFQVGQEASFQKKIEDKDLRAFVELTGDDNPIHLDDDFAQEILSTGSICHGMLASSFISTLVGVMLPGAGALYRSQKLSFLSPVFVGDTLTISGKITGIDSATKILKIHTEIVNQDDKKVISGTAEVIFNPPQKKNSNGWARPVECST